MRRLISDNRDSINSRDGDMKLLSTKQAAELITLLTGKKITRREVSREVKKGKIKAELIVGGTYLIKESTIRNYKRRKPGPRPKRKRKKKNELDRTKE
jgi:hypothetical protein